MTFQSHTLKTGGTYIILSDLCTFVLFAECSSSLSGRASQFLLTISCIFAYCSEKEFQPTENVHIENNINITVIFPDTSLPEPTNGGFQTQEEFVKFVTEHEKTGKWNSELHARPLAEQLDDYKDDTLALAFPLQFPYGFTGLPADPAVIKLSKLKGKRNLLSRNCMGVYQKYLQHRKTCFHSAMFNLIVENLIMKQSIFNSTRMYCNIKCSNGSTMGEKYGAMTANHLQRAIHHARQNLSVQHSAAAENQFLKSIRASCSKLPHSNESAEDARKIYFSFLMAFGLPAIFLTITPDDLRNFRIIVYSCVNVEEKIYGDYKPSDFSDKDILKDFTIRRTARFDHPGLCAEEYNRIIQLVIKHLFNWDIEKQESKGLGIFGELLAWCLATEEQGRKNLHGHFLLFIKNWQKILKLLQMQAHDKQGSGLSYPRAVREAKAFYDSVCSARLFQDFGVGRAVQGAVFSHDPCRNVRTSTTKKMRFTVKPVDDQALREMRHKVLCHEHNGKIATCAKCSRDFTVNEIIETALNTHLAKPSNIDRSRKTISFQFPEGNNQKRLDRLVYELQKNFDWLDDPAELQALRLFASSALVNVHLTCHANRCFKKGSECYANIPDQITDSTQILYNDEYDIWTDCWGNKSPRYMFRFQPKRPVEDVFMNVHSPIITSLLGCNNNVTMGMNGRSVFYVTGYNTKAQQKDERVAFEKISSVMVDVLQRQVRYCFQPFCSLQKPKHISNWICIICKLLY